MKRERFPVILKMLDEKGSVTVPQIAKKLNVSEVTIRADLNELRDQGLLERTHGGACKQGDNLYKGNTQETVYRDTLNKMVITKYAFSLLDTNDTIIIDDSSTCLYLVKQIRKHTDKKLIIYTNSIFVVSELIKANHVSIHMLGGEISPNLGSSSGKTMERQLDGVKADYCFLGANGVSIEKGVSVIGYPQMKTKQVMMKAAKNKVLLVDAKKFGLYFSSVVAPVDRFDKIVTDACHSSDALDKVYKAGNVQIAPD